MTVQEVYGLSMRERFQRYEQYGQQLALEKLPTEAKQQILETLKAWERHSLLKTKTVERALEEVWQITVSAEDVEAFPEYEGVPIDPWLEMYFELRWELEVWYDDTLGLDDVDESTAP
jgi:hypothetical protein